MPGDEVNGNGNLNSSNAIAPPDAPTKTILDRIANFKFEAFVPGKDNWKYYFQRFEMEMGLLQLSGTSFAPYRRDLLLRAIGSEMYRVVAEHFSPKPLSLISYEETTAFLTSHNTTPVSYIIARCEFGQCVRDTTMSVADFLAKLRSLAPDCQFGASLDERLRDQFLIGLKNPAMIERISELHRSPTDKLSDIVTTALNIEAAQRQRAAFESTQPSLPPNLPSSASQVNLIRHQSTKKNASFSGDQKKVDQSNRSNNSSGSKGQPNEGHKKGNKGSSSAHKPASTSPGTNAHPLSLNPSEHCLRCAGKRHSQPSDCRALNAVCRLCQKKGHYDRACVASGRAQIQHKTVHYVAQPAQPEISFDADYRHLYVVHSFNVRERYLIHPVVNRQKLEMEYDTAADIAVIGAQTWKRFGSPKLHPAKNATGYGNAPIDALGEFNVSVQLGGTARTLPLLVSSREGATLFGKNWMSALNVGPLSSSTSRFLTHVTDGSSHSINTIAEDPDVASIMAQFNTLFESKKGTVRTFQALFEVESSAQPRIFKPRSVPIAFKRAVNAELDRLVADDVLEPINVMETPIEWASPLVIDIKKNGKVRICADFKVTINRYIKKQLHPLPHLSEVANDFAGFTEFSIIDLKDAYYQVIVHPSCRKYLTIATEKGYFQYKRLPFGITIAPMLFQRFMDTVFADIPGVVCVQDDIALGGIDRIDHLNRLRLVLQRLQQVGLAVQPEKVSLLKKEITFLGHIIDANGIRPVPTKVDAIKSMPPPKNISELRSFLGSINQFNSFVPNLLPSCQNLHRLLQKHNSWLWGKAEQETFDHLKTLITSDQVLAHFDPRIPVILSCDASEYGIGAVLLHQYSDGRIRLISAASRTLTSAEKNYSSIDREALAIIFGVDKFYKYLFGRHFYLQTDHKPLERLFGEKAEIPKLAASRLIRWAIQLSAFDYTLTYVPGSQNCIADALSRLPIPGSPTTFELRASQSVQQIVTESLENFSLTRNILRVRTQRDHILQTVACYMSTSWPQSSNLPADLVPYYDKKDVLTFEKGILMFGQRVVIPESLKQIVLQKLHFTHPGISAAKSLARATVWWPKCDFDIETFVKNCSHCQKHGPREPQTPLNLWNTPEKPWDRLHIDFTGPFEGHYWFVVIDAYSRWLEIFPMSNATTCNTIQLLRLLFCRFGVPRQIVSDNGAQFTSHDFKNFCSQNGVKLAFTTPYHSRSNGLVERAIRTFKWRFSKISTAIPDHKLRLQEMLFMYRTTEHSTTGRTPAELFFGRRINTPLDLLKPSVRSTIDQRQFMTKYYKDRHSSEREFSPGAPVYVRRPVDQTWSSAVISHRTSPLSYTTMAGQRVHADHLKERVPEKPSTPDPVTPSPPTRSVMSSHSPVIALDSPVPDSSPPTPVVRRSARPNKGIPPLTYREEFIT